MTQYFARLDGAEPLQNVMEIIELPDNLDVKECFPAALVKLLVKMANADSVSVGMQYDGTTFTPEPGPTLAEQQADFIAAASATCAVVTSSVCPDNTHLLAVQLGFSAVMANGGQAPTIEPVATMFAENAQTYGKTVAEFVPMVIALGGVQMSLSTALGTAEAASAAATTAVALGSAVDNFNNSIAGLVGAIQAQGVNIPVPNPVQVAGVPSGTPAAATAGQQQASTAQSSTAGTKVST